MTFEQHIFISYAHLDNQPLTPAQQGWISHFHATLATILTMRLGRAPKIWRDSKLNGNDMFADQIMQLFPKTAVLLSVLTPCYVESAWCTREAYAFCQAAESSGGLVVENKARIFKVIKLPVDSEASLPDIMRDMLGHEFYTWQDDNTPIELDPAYGQLHAEQFRRKTVGLASQVADMIKTLDPRDGGSGSQGQPRTAKAAVYLCECSRDRQSARLALGDELRALGYAVLPDRSLPNDESAYRSEVANALAQCSLSVHLVGETYGRVPDGPSEKSVVVLQNELAVERSKQGLLQRVISLPDGITASGPQQREFIALLHASEDAQCGADLITGDLEDVKAAIHANLKQLDERSRKVTPLASVNGTDKHIQVLCDERDREETIPLRLFLQSHGYDARLPIFKGNAAAVREANRELLLECEGVILFYGAGDELWKHAVESDLHKVKALRRQRALPAHFVYLAAPAAADKVDLISMRRVRLINCLQGFSAERMQPFLDTLRGVES
jgi:hypothetical protein